MYSLKKIKDDLNLFDLNVSNENYIILRCNILHTDNFCESIEISFFLQQNVGQLIKLRNSWRKKLICHISYVYNSDSYQIIILVCRL